MLQALLAAGFRLNEYAALRAVLDALHARHIKVLVCDAALLDTPVAAAAATAEMDWTAPRPPNAAGGGGWGSQRAILFTGLTVAAQV